MNSKFGTLMSYPSTKSILPQFEDLRLRKIIYPEILTIFFIYLIFLQFFGPPLQFIHFGLFFQRFFRFLESQHNWFVKLIRVYFYFTNP